MAITDDVGSWAYGGKAPDAAYNRVEDLADEVENYPFHHHARHAARTLAAVCYLQVPEHH